MSDLNQHTNDRSSISDGLVVFSYDHPHRKVRDFLSVLAKISVKPKFVLAAPWIEIKEEEWRRAEKAHFDASGVPHPRLLCHRQGINYEVAEHNSEKAVQILQETRPAFGLIAGARILTEQVISLFGQGILNIHPGILPYSRGLDATWWALLEHQPLGVTAHLIDQRVDAGRIVSAKPVDIATGDSIRDLTRRVYLSQVDVLSRALSALSDGPPSNFRRIADEELGPLRGRMPFSLFSTLSAEFGEQMGSS